MTEIPVVPESCKVFGVSDMLIRGNVLKAGMIKSCLKELSTKSCQHLLTMPKYILRPSRLIKRVMKLILELK